MSQAVTTISSNLAQQYFELKIEAPLTEQELLEVLAKHIKNLLDFNFQGLLNAMYRVDVDEAKFKYILSYEAPDTIASHVARLVLDRLKQKAITRIKYSG